MKIGAIDKAGAWYSCNGQRIGQGKENVRDYLREHVDMAQEVEAKIRAEFLTKPEKKAPKKAEEIATAEGDDA